MHVRPQNRRSVSAPFGVPKLFSGKKRSDPNQLSGESSSPSPTSAVKGHFEFPPRFDKPANPSVSDDNGHRRGSFEILSRPALLSAKEHKKNLSLITEATEALQATISAARAKEILITPVKRSKIVTPSSRRGSIIDLFPQSAPPVMTPLDANVRTRSYR